LIIIKEHGSFDEAGERELQIWYLHDKESAKRNYGADA
jgi:hypothetical protein